MNLSDLLLLLASLALSIITVAISFFRRTKGNKSTLFGLVEKGAIEVAWIILKLDRKKAKAKQPPRPRRGAHWAIRFLTSYKEQETILGDIEEIYQNVVKERGTKSANRWYRWQVFCTIVALTWGKVRKLGWAVAIGAALRKLIG